jgi:glucose/arabinose dehydrogenase
MTVRVLLLLAAVCALPVHVQAQIRTEVVASGLTQPLAFVEDPAFAGVYYIVEQSGVVKVLRNGAIQSEPFVDLRSAITTGGERGLLGMAFSPDVLGGRVFFNFTNTNGDTVVARFRRTAAAPFQVESSSRFDLRWPDGERFIRQPFSNHNGGNLVFGPDGYLYIGLGDGGSGNDPENNAQNPSTLLGKMLRIDVNVVDGDPNGYRVPTDNPFVDDQPIGALREIWAFGLRNPWRYSFDDVGAGASFSLLIGDVGQGAREEINFEPSGAGGRNYGWRLREGRIATPGISPTAPAYGPLIDPVFDYGRDLGQTVTGGFVYRGTALSAAYRGRYFFADSSASRVWSLGLGVNAAGEVIVLDRTEHTAELGGSGVVGPVTSFGRDRQGELYLVSFNGTVLKIVPDLGTPPAAPTNVSAIVAGRTVTVNWIPPASGPLPDGYQLEAGSSPGALNIGVVRAGASQTSLTFANVPVGTYYVRVRSLNAAGGSGASNEITIVVQGGGCSLPPPAPTEFASSVNGRVVTLSWGLPATTDGPAELLIEAGSASGAANLAVIVIDATLRTFTVQAPPGQYFVRIRGRNACGAGAGSNEIIVTVF